MRKDENRTTGDANRPLANSLRSCILIFLYRVFFFKLLSGNKKESVEREKNYPSTVPIKDDIKIRQKRG